MPESIRTYQELKISLRFQAQCKEEGCAWNEKGILNITIQKSTDEEAFLYSHLSWGKGNFEDLDEKCMDHHTVWHNMGQHNVFDLFHESQIVGSLASNEGLAEVAINDTFVEKFLSENKNNIEVYKY